MNREDSPEMESFSISDADIAFSLNPDLRFHPSMRRGQSKNSQIYGIWADSDSDTEGDRQVGFGKSNKKGSGLGFSTNRANFSKSGPVQFISGGIKEGSGQDAAKEKLDTNNVDEVNDSDDYITLITETEKKTAVKKKKTPKNIIAESLIKDFGGWERHTRGIGMKLLAKMGYEPGKGLGPEGKGIITPVQAGPVRKGKEAVGFYGKEGPSAPLRGDDLKERETEDSYEVVTSNKFAPRRQYIKGKNNEKPTYVYKSASDIIAEDSKNRLKGISSDKQGMFLKNSIMSKVKVIDMTGREQRVYSGYHNLSRQKTTEAPADQDFLGDEGAEEAGKVKPSSAKGITSIHVDQEGFLNEKARHFEMPTLLHNIDLLLDRTQETVISCHRAHKSAEDRLVNLKHEETRIQKICVAQNREIGRLEVAIDLLTDFEEFIHQMDSSSDLDMEQCALWVRRVQQQCADLPEFAHVLAAMAFPLIDKTMQRWPGLKEPRYGQSTLVEWRNLLSQANGLNEEANAQLIDRILQCTWLPVLRKSLQSWDPRYPEPVLAVLEAWSPFLLPTTLKTLVLEQLVYPRLEAAIDQWNPLTDVVPVHSWMHPWLPWFDCSSTLSSSDTLMPSGNESSVMFSSRLSPLHDKFRFKLGQCLSHWHPRDPSAHVLLLPWQPVFGASEWTNFLRRHILPRLQMVLEQELHVEPNSDGSSANIDPWHWVMRWKNLIPPSLLANLLEQSFLPRWLRVLQQWLNQSNGCDLGEVARWYSGWKSLLPSEILDYPNICDALSRALQMMKQRMAAPISQPVSSALLQPPPPPPVMTASNVASALYPGMSSAGAPPISAKERLEMKAMELGLVFVPVPGRYFQGRQIYRLGNSQVCLDGNVVFQWQGTVWVPQTPEDACRRAL